MAEEFPVPMQELREASIDRLLEPMRARTEEIGAGIWNELAAMGLVLIDINRVERLLAAARKYADEFGCEPGECGLEVGDLDEFP